MIKCDRLELAGFTLWLLSSYNKIRLWSVTDVSSADSRRVVDCKAAPSLTRCRYIFQVLHTSVISSTKVRERVAAVLRWYSWNIRSSHSCKRPV